MIFSSSFRLSVVNGSQSPSCSGPFLRKGKNVQKPSSLDKLSHGDKKQSLSTSLGPGFGSGLNTNMSLSNDVI